MRPSCACRVGRLTPDRGGQRFALLVDTDIHPMVELVAARLLLIALDELRSEGIVGRQVHVELHGCLQGP